MGSSSRNLPIFVRRLWQCYPQAESAEKAIILRLHELDRKFGFWSNLPTDLNRLLPAVGVSEVKSIDRLDVNGRLVPNRSREFVEEFRVELAKTISPTRRRFTLGHEIAHALLRKGSSFNELCGSIDPQEERLCNYAAGEILVPKAALRKQLRKHKGTFRSSNVKALAEVFDVSLTCMMCRIVEVHEDVIGFMVHDVVEQNSRLRLVCTRAIPSRWERIELHNASDSKIMMAFVNQKSVYGIQEFDMSTSATGVRWVCSEPIRKSERKQCHTIVTLIYQRPQPQPQKISSPLFSMGRVRSLPKVLRPANQFHCLSCDGTGWESVHEGVAACQCRVGLVIDSVPNKPFLLKISY